MPLNKFCEALRSTGRLPLGKKHSLLLFKTWVIGDGCGSYICIV